MSNKAPRSISKTSFLAGYQCPKLLWTKLRDPDKLPSHDDGKAGSPVTTG